MNVDLAPYALGALTLADRAEVQRHLADCRSCRDELADLAGVLALLRRMPTDQVGLPEPGPDSEASPAPRAQPMPRRRRVLAVGAAALVLFAASLVGVRVWTSQGSSAAPVTVADKWSTRDQTSNVAASAALRQQPWGTTVNLTLSDLPPRLTCRLVVRSVDGTRQSIGAWRTGYTHSISLPAATAYRLEDIAALDVVTSQGDRLVSLPAPERHSQPPR
jgi:hypothetical protein